MLNLIFWFLNIIIVTLLLSLIWLSKRRHLYKLAQKIDGPESWPILGTLPRFIGKDNAQILEELQALMAEYTPPVKVWMGPVLTILIDRPEHLKIVLNSPDCLDKAYLYDFLVVKFGLMVQTSEQKINFDKKQYTKAIYFFLCSSFVENTSPIVKSLL